MMDERGSGTVWVLALSLVVGLAAIAGGSWGLAAAARHRAEAAADLAALAAAGEAIWGAGRACAAAARIATENGAQLDRCELKGDVAEIRVRRQLRLGRLSGRTAFASARAGPVA